MTIDEKSIRRKLYEAANINGWITAEQAAAIAEQYLALLESPEVVKFPTISKFKITSSNGSDVVAEENEWFCHAHEVETYAKAVKSALAAITSFIKGVQVQSSESAQKVGSSPATPTSYAEPPAPDSTDSKDKQP